MDRRRASLLTIPAVVFGLLLAGCFGPPGVRTTDTDAVRNDVGLAPILSVEQASVAYGGILCDFAASIREFGETADDPQTQVPEMNAAAALLQRDLLGAAASVRAAAWPSQVLDDMTVIAAKLQASAESLTGVIEATTSPEIATAAEAALSGGPDTDAAEARIEQVLSPPACGDIPKAPYHSVEELRRDYIRAGGSCPDSEWALATYYPPATQAGNCKTAFLAIYSNTADRDLGRQMFERFLAGGVLDLLVGTNWILGAVAPAQFAERLGGTVVDP
jgi:hypothetical protein